MPKHIIEFNLPEEKEELDLAMSGSSFYIAVGRVGNEIFRPARKHGYNDQELQALVNKIGPDAIELIGLLEDKFYEILEEENVQSL